MAGKKKNVQVKSVATRPPIVVVMGHVDHGKTTLLDKIRSTNIAAAEHGGITQHIGAYQVELTGKSNQGKKITFIDTPGHAAFAEMRSRGAMVADLAILVVSAEEGVKPQTLESLRFINEAKISYLVALNKIDLPGVNIEKAKSTLIKNGILAEGYGGNMVVVPVSAKTGIGIDELLEMILLLGEMQGLKGKANDPLEAVVIESSLDRRRGPVATVLVRNGSIKVGDQIIAGDKTAKIKAMFDDLGRPLKVVLPGQPVEILGLTNVAEVGEKVFLSGQQTKPEKEIVEVPVAGPEEITPEVQEQKAGDKKLKIILKADTRGTMEAIVNSLPKEVTIISDGMGDVSESDVLLAQPSGAEIIGFNVKISKSVVELAESEKVKTTVFQVIYELLEEIDKKVLRLIEPTIDEEVLGTAEIIAEFEIDKERIAGCRVKEGEINRAFSIHLKRGEQIFASGRMKSMKHEKATIEKAKTGEEFGAVFSPYLDFKTGDMLISFRKQEKND